MCVFVCVCVRERERESSRKQVLSFGHGHDVALGEALEVHLAKKQPSPLGPPEGPRHSPTVGSYGGTVSYERGDPCRGARYPLNPKPRTLNPEPQTLNPKP